MSPKRVRGIMVGATLLIGGVVFFGLNRRKKLLYKAITDKIGGYGGGYSGGGSLGGDATGCNLSAEKTSEAVEDLHNAIDGWGTDEAAINRVTRQAQTLACFNKVANLYRQQHGSNLIDDIRNELNDTDYTKWNDIYQALR